MPIQSVVPRPLARLARLALVALVALVAAPACSSETGIVIEVSQEGLTTTPDTLRFYIGVEMDAAPIFIPQCGDAIRFQDRGASPDREIALDGRDLGSDPYRLLLRPGEDLALEDDVMIVVAALSGEDIIAVAGLEGSVSFIDGKVLSWKVALKGANQDTSTTTITVADCACHRAADGLLAIIPSDDADCDADPDVTDCDAENAAVGMYAPERCFNQVDDNCDGRIDEQVDEDGDGVFNCEDCKDTNPDVYPGAPEICDGLDNDCDESTPRFPEGPVDCYARDSGDCWVGTRTCNDFDEANGGWTGECTPTSFNPHDQVSDTICDRFDACATELPHYQDAYECAGALFTRYECRLDMIGRFEGGAYDVCDNFFPLGNNIPLDTTCRWTLIGGPVQDEYQAGLWDPTGTAYFAGVTELCQAMLRIEGAHVVVPEDPLYSEVDLWAEVDGQPFDHIRLQITPNVIADPNGICPTAENALSCVRVPGQ